MMYELPERLTEIEERDLLDAYFLGDEHAKDELITHNLYLVVLEAKKYVDEKNCIDDLVQVGTVGLIKAIDSYNNNEYGTFNAHIIMNIENELKHYLNK